MRDRLTDVAQDSEPYGHAETVKPDRDMSRQSNNTPHGRSRQARRTAEEPAGKHARTVPRLIGYAILGLALLLIAIGSAIA
jgi:hypothetical protein